MISHFTGHLLHYGLSSYRTRCHCYHKSGGLHFRQVEDGRNGLTGEHFYL